MIVLGLAASILQSPLLQERASAETFWEEVSSPLVEEIPGEADHRLVTFLWKDDGQTERVQLVGGIADLDYRVDGFQRLEGTDIWYLTKWIKDDIRTVYFYAVNGPELTLADVEIEELDSKFADFLSHIRPDPLNPAVYQFGHEFTGSLLELPNAPAPSYSAGCSSVERGALVEHAFHSDILNNDRKVVVYTPPGFVEGSSYPLLILFDGSAYRDLVPTPTILDNLIAEGKIPPLVASFVDNVDGTSRNKELPCNAAFADFLGAEFLPWMQERYGVSNDPQQIVVAGSSFGGLAAAYAAFRHPELFGNVLSQSGGFYWREAPDGKSNLILNLYAESTPLPLRFYLDVGTEEDRIHFKDLPTTWEVNQQMRDLLLSKGYELHYAVFSGGHDYVCWKETLADGLVFLLGNM